MRTIDLTPEGFIPINKLTLGDLPEPIRTEKHLQYILDFSKRVVKINNNGLSDKRPDEDQFKMRKHKTMLGSGILCLQSKGVSFVSTCRHVLFNEEELHNASFEVFYDYHHGDPDDKEKLRQLCGRRRGICFIAKSSRFDAVIAAYRGKDAMATHIREHCPGCDNLPRQWVHIESQASTEGKTVPSIVCLISHPLGQPKHVSFGEMIDFDTHKGILHHNAPTKPGSGGGPLLVFSDLNFGDVEKSTILQVGRNLISGFKIATVPDLAFSKGNVGKSISDLQNNIKSMPHRELLVSGDMTEIACASLEVTSLAAYAPVFGAFLLHAETIRQAGFDMSALKPCKNIQRNDYTCFSNLQPRVRDFLQQIAKMEPRFLHCPIGNSHDPPDLASLLESQGLCFCQSIVQMMERGITLEDGSVTECYLSPYTTAAKMSSDSDVTWPWLHSRNTDRMIGDVAEEECLVMKCLRIIDSTDGITIPISLLLMIIEANASIRQRFKHATDVPLINAATEGKHQWEGTPSQSGPSLWREPRSGEHCRGSLPSTTSARNEREEPPAADSEKEGFGRARHVLEIIRLVVSFTFASFTAEPFRDAPVSPRPDHRHSELEILLSSCLSHSHHALQHEQQIHPDAESSGEGRRDWCHCGRPGYTEVEMSLQALQECLEQHTMVDSQEGRPTKNVTGTMNNMDRNFAGYFVLFLRAFHDLLLRWNLPNPENITLGYIHNVRLFPQGRNPIMLYLASREALLYNCCMLAKHISKSLRQRYFAFPVSRFGRPGNWPGNVTPPEVQRTAWRLIQDAIMASGFSPAVLSALEEDAERREKLIDLYVDMKQLKWKGRIQPHLFEKYLALSHQSMGNYLQPGLSFEDKTHYYVWCARFLLFPKIGHFRRISQSNSLSDKSHFSPCHS